MIITRAKRNVSLLPKIAQLAVDFGYHTRPLVEIAAAAAGAKLELIQFYTIAELAVRKLSGSEPVELAHRAAAVGSAEEIPGLDEDIREVDRRADFGTLQEALEAQEKERRLLEDRIKNL